MNDFDIWNERKKWFHANKKRPNFKEGEVWWTAIGQNIGSEIYGKGGDFLRPCLIIKNTNKKSCIIIPLTSIPKKHPSAYLFKDKNNRLQCCLFHQIKNIDTKRLIRKKYSIKKDMREEIKINLKKWL